MPRARTIACCAAALAAAPAAQAQLLPPPPAPPATAPAPPATIAPGVTAAGVELEGLTVEQATAKLQTALDGRLRQAFALRIGRRSWRLRLRRVRFAFDAARTARRALKARPAPGARIGIPLSLRHSRRAVRRFVKRVAARLYRAPRQANLRITLRRMVMRGGRSGHELRVRRAARRISRLLDDNSLRRRLRVRLRRLPPSVTKASLRRSYGTVITIERGSFTLRLFKHLRYDRSYQVAVGQPAHPTPTGLFHIQSKQVNPVWTAPNSPWAGELAGQSFAGGSANNPLKARWMGVSGGVGIHGTGEDWSIGSAASHGCIRMHVWDVVELFGRTPIGAPVLIG